MKSFWTTKGGERRKKKGCTEYAEEFRSYSLSSRGIIRTGLLIGKEEEKRRDLLNYKSLKGKG